MIKATAPGGGGFVIELLTWRAWKPKWSTPNKLLLTDPLFLMRDVNQDGVTDEAVLTDFNDIQNVRQYYEHEDYDYH